MDVEIHVIVLLSYVIRSRMRVLHPEKPCVPLRKAKKTPHVGISPQRLYANTQHLSFLRRGSWRFAEPSG